MIFSKNFINSQKEFFSTQVKVSKKVKGLDKSVELNKNAQDVELNKNAQDAELNKNARNAALNSSSQVAALNKDTLDEGLNKNIKSAGPAKEVSSAPRVKRKYVRKNKINIHPSTSLIAHKPVVQPPVSKPLAHTVLDGKKDSFTKVTSVTSLLNQNVFSLSCPFPEHDFSKPLQANHLIFIFRHIAFAEDTLKTFTSFILQNISLRVAVSSYLATFVLTASDSGTVTVFVSLKSRFTISSLSSFVFEKSIPSIYKVHKPVFALRFILTSFNRSNSSSDTFFLSNIEKLDFPSG